MSKEQYRIPSPIVDFKPPVYICKRAGKPFHLDGNIHKEFWKDASFTEDFIDIEGDSKPIPRYRTRAKMMWDDDNLYFAALLEGDEIWANVTKRDDIIFQDNDFEIFIDPDSDTQQYYEFEMNARNTVWDLLLTKAYRDMGLAVNAWDIKGLKTAVFIDGKLNKPDSNNKFWSVEVVMPFESLLECAKDKQLPKHGDYWRVNFSRVQWLVDVKNGSYEKRINKETGLPYPEDNWVWAPTGVVNIHYPELWGFLFFSIADTLDTEKDNFFIPKDEIIKWQLRKLYYAEHQYKDSNGVFTSDINCLADSQTFPLSVTIETTRHSFEISCKNSEGTGEIVLFSDGLVCSR